MNYWYENIACIDDRFDNIEVDKLSKDVSFSISNISDCFTSMRNVRLKNAKNVIIGNK